jgi:carbamoyltransferase
MLDSASRPIPPSSAAQCRLPRILPVKIVGLSALAHDPAACLATPLGIVAAVEEERLTRRKSTRGFPSKALRAVLDIGKAGIEDVDTIAYYWDDIGQFSRTVRDLWREVGALGTGTTCSLTLRRARAMSAKRRLQAALKDLFGPRRVLPPVVAISHHEAHIAAGLVAAPFEPQAGLVIDGRGETASTSLYCFLRGAGVVNPRIALLESIPFPHSLGVFFGVVTQILGYRPLLDEYKVMGLASYGQPDPELRRRVERLLVLQPNGHFRLDLSLVACKSCDDPALPWLSARGLELFKGTYRDGDHFTDTGCNLAFEAQRLLNLAIERLARRLVELTAAQRIVIAGGVAMNGCAINHVRRTGIVEDIYVPLAPYDAGAALGAAVAIMLRSGRTFEQGQIMQSPYLGPEYDEGEIARALGGGPWTQEHHANIEDVVAAEIAGGRVVGWFQGRMEFGQRALGARSILADPRIESMRDKVNSSIKLRESYRPFAPSVLEEDASAYFDIKSNHFMSEVTAATSRARIEVPAVVHVDRTARPQTVAKTCPVPRYRVLIERFKRLTGTPMVLNTSFNLAGEPIVCSPHDAVQCFAKSRLDALAIGTFLLRREHSQ